MFLTDRIQKELANFILDRGAMALAGLKPLVYAAYSLGPKKHGPG